MCRIQQKQLDANFYFVYHLLVCKLLFQLVELYLLYYDFYILLSSFSMQPVNSGQFIL